MNIVEKHRSEERQRSVRGTLSRVSSRTRSIHPMGWIRPSITRIPRDLEFGGEGGGLPAGASRDTRPMGHRQGHTLARRGPLSNGQVSRLESSRLDAKQLRIIKVRPNGKRQRNRSSLGEESSPLLITVRACRSSRRADLWIKLPIETCRSCGTERRQGRPKGGKTYRRVSEVSSTRGAKNEKVGLITPLRADCCR